MWRESRSGSVEYIEAKGNHGIVVVVVYSINCKTEAIVNMKTTSNRKDARIQSAHVVAMQCNKNRENIVWTI